jgi:acyl dehydratase
VLDVAYAQLSWRDVAEGDTLPTVTLDITLRRLFVNAAAAWDTFPGHFDRGYARAHGHPDIFANTSLLLAVADRVITDWAGPRTRILRRKLTMGRPVYPGDQLSGTGVVTARRRVGDGHLVDVEVELVVQNIRCAHGVATIELPARPDKAVSVPTTMP